MLWKFFAEKFFSEPLALDCHEEIRLCTSANFFQWGEFTISIGGTLQPAILPLGFCLALSSPQPKEFLILWRLHHVQAAILEAGSKPE
jgi:hypothetical protein